MEFNQSTFFKFGMILYLIISLAGTWGILMEWSYLPIWAKISRIASNMFSYAITYFFYYLWTTFRNSAGTPLSNDDLNKLLKEGKDEGR